MASKVMWLLSKRGVVLALAVGGSVALGKAGLPGGGFGFFDGPR